MTILARFGWRDLAAIKSVKGVYQALFPTPPPHLINRESEPWDEARGEASPPNLQILPQSPSASPPVPFIQI